MLRVLQVVNIMDRAGLETMLMNYYRNIDRTQIQFDFLTHRDENGAYDDEIKSLGGKIYHAPRLYPQNYIAYFHYMSRFFSEHPEYKIVHSHIDTMSAFPLYAAKKAGISYRIGHSHSSKLDLDYKLPIKYLAKCMMPYEANLYCACSKTAGKLMYGRRNVNLINNAIDLDKFAFNNSDRLSIRKKLGIEEKYVIGHVGRYYYVKNQEFLMAVLKKICETRDSVLLLVGKGEDETKLREKAKELGISNNVIFLIDRKNVNEIYQAMDAFIMPSLFEGLPVVGVEAQANGLPCLFSDKISKEVILTDNAEMLSIKQNPEIWANKILTMCRSNSMDSKKQLTERGYDIKQEAIKLMNWYQELYN